jgi:peptide/nickel transport system permease protein
MRRYILNRLLLGLITLIGVSIIIFAASRATGDVTYLLAPQTATEEELQEIRHMYGLDQPIPVQYYIFVKNALHGDFGNSISFSRPTMEIILSRLPATLELGLLAFLLGNLIGVLFGIISATKRNSWTDWSGKIFALLGQAMPNFWVAVMLVMIFAVKLGWLPTSGIGGIRHLILPVIALSWFQMSFSMRLIRSSLLDVMDSEYVKLARIKGNPERVVIWKHALRNSLIPVVSMAGMGLAFTIGGSVFIETIFRWPGIGILMYQSILSRDYPLIQAITMITATFIILINLLVDLIYVVIDPRIKYE